MYRNKSLNKMLLLSPEVYEKLKNDLEDTANQSLFDKSMNKILNSKQLSDKEKWYNYRNELIKFLNLKRKLKVISTPKKEIFNVKHGPEVEQKNLRDNATQTRFVFKADKATQVVPEPIEVAQPTPEPIEDFFETPFDEETTPKQSLTPDRNRRLSASAAVKNLKPSSKEKSKEYRVVTADDGITQITIPADMDIDEAIGLFDQDKDASFASVPKKDKKSQSTSSILRPSQSNPRQNILAFPVRKAPVRQSSRLKTQKSQTRSETDQAWDRL